MCIGIIGIGFDGQFQIFHGVFRLAGEQQKHPPFSQCLLVVRGDFQRLSEIIELLVVVFGQAGQQHQRFDLRFGVIFRKVSRLLGRFHGGRMIAAGQGLQSGHQQVGLGQFGIDFQRPIQIAQRQNPQSRPPPGRAFDDGFDHEVRPLHQGAGQQIVGHFGVAGIETFFQSAFAQVDDLRKSSTLSAASFLSVALSRSSWPSFSARAICELSRIAAATAKTKKVNRRVMAYSVDR